MRKTSTMKKIAVAAGVTLALVASMTIGSGRAMASTTPGYLSPPDLSTTNSIGSSPITVTTSSGKFTIYSTPTSLFGNTIPSSVQLQSFLSANEPGVPSNVVIGSISDTGTPFYSISGISTNANGCGASGCTLDLTLVNQKLTNYTSTLSPGATGPVYSGQVLSNVFKVGSGSNLPGATPGELVFTYQFDVTGQSSYSNGYVGPTAGSVSFYNDPNGYIYTLGTGSVDTSSISGTTINCSTCTSLSGNGLQGTVTYDTINGSIETLTYLNNSQTIFQNEISPEIFVASNATNYTIGSLTLGGSGSTLVADVFVPTTPEPGTLVLFGTALGLLAFMVVRNRRSQEIA